MNHVQPALALLGPLMALSLLGCAGARSQPTVPAEDQAAVGSSPEPPSSSDSAGQAAERPSPADPQPATPDPPLPDGREVEGALPEVHLKQVGLHIGGGPNDPETKAPFEQAILGGAEEIKRCYRLVQDPEKGGVFGVDLAIGREGGRPEVRDVRTAMGGPEFRECVSTAFASVRFARPTKGPTVISYSIRFSLEPRP